MSKVLIFNDPSSGHFNPTVALTQELISRGEQVIYYESSEYQSKVEATGASFRSTDISTFISRVTGGKRFGRALSGLAPIIDKLAPLVQEEKPDYVMYDSMCVWGRILAEILHVPTIRLNSTYVFSEYTFSPLQVASQSFLIAKIILAIIRTPLLQSPLDRITAKYGLKVVQFDQLFTQPEMLDIVFLPKTFQIAADKFGESFKFVGPSMQRREEGVEDFPFASLQASGKPLLYISLGTNFNKQASFYKECITAFKDSTMWQVVMAVGNRVDVDSLGSIPSNFIIRSSVPQLKLLEQVSVFITHGGMNSTMEALYNGVPLIVLPQMGEQKITARQVSALGLGITLQKSTKSGSMELRQAVETIQQTPTYRQQTHHMRQLMLEAGGYQQAATEILRFKENALALHR